MHDSEFEKQVQQKMQELRFAPGADVWARVEADIRKKKRRRPVIFWLLFAGLLVGGGSAMLYFGNYMPETDKTATKNTVEKNNTVKSSAPLQQNNTETARNKSNDQPINNKSIIHDQPLIKKKVNNDKKALVKTNAAAPVLPDAKTTQTLSEPEQSNNTVTDSTIANPLVFKPGITTQLADTILTANEDDIANTKVDSNKETTTDNAAKNIIKDSAVALKTGNPKKPSAKKSTWQWGISASAGISDLGRKLFQTTSVADFAYANLNSNPTPVTPNYGSSRPSSVSPGAAFHSGGYASKNIGKKTALRFGLNYDYYSNSIRVGSQVNTARFVNQGTDMKMVEQYYTSGNSNQYHNKYHFISLPLSLQWKLRDGAKRGLVWENGIIASQLIKTTALHFDGITGTYYKDDALFKKTQLMFSSALLLTIKSKNNVQLYAGPQLQYGISNLVGKDAGNDKHLRYAGLMLMVGFNKK